MDPAAETELAVVLLRPRARRCGRKDADGEEEGPILLSAVLGVDAADGLLLLLLPVVVLLLIPPPPPPLSLLPTPPTVTV